ncbi:hypothetical protein [Ktedonobacter racemifer]|uniref:Uncharacterized membrane protein, predicted transporter n=1 Tax=Ktedonobacter racemifer DSM 44963 TaxID=485913 RepID=D6TNP2_KTERA|nr:hypothetical protein [Ktedonobacter racemifer]EFH87373.1 uncharacterized membrane protein, predicted transporter [Ktedonobacter racemifer DSM 44963]
MRRFPFYGKVALALCFMAWACSWLRVEPFYRYSFFPLWLGYILTLDALNRARKGSSLLHRMGKRFPLLFLVSSLFWWIFEWFNNFVQNWHYRLDQPYTPLAYFLIASLNFSTVLPAVMETTELLSSFKPFHPRLLADQTGPRLPLPLLLGVEALGLLCLVLPILWPQYYFGLIWLCLALLLDPVNNWFGRKSTLAHLAVGDWHFIVLPLGTLICGFFWEMWNYFSLPKWYYTIPYIEFWKIFEMPLLGYIGYLPFGLELFALYQFVLLLLRQKEGHLSF